MRLRFVFIMVCLLVGTNAARSQGFNAILYCETQPILLNCVDGAPVPDGVNVQIFWDSLGNGPTADDRQPVEGPGFLQVNYNQFPLNGNSELEVPGGFFTDPAFEMTTAVPNPDLGQGHPLYWLRVCLDAQTIFWTSDTFRLQPGTQMITFGLGPDEVPFTCNTGVCAGCPVPNPVTNVTASQAYCDSIVIDWDHDMDNIAGYRVRIGTDGPFVFIQGAANTRYVDLTSVGGQAHEFRVRAYRICGTGQDADTVYSAAVLASGRKLVSPPVPTNVVASDTLCGQVNVSWGVATILGLDSFRIYRNNIHIGSVNRGTAGNRSFIDSTPLAPPTVANYCVRGYSITCSTGVAVCDNGGARGVPTCVVTNVVASDDICQHVAVTWSATCTDADSFQILRNATLLTTVTATGGPNFSYNDASAVAGTTYGYQIRPKNTCGNGATLFPVPAENGTRAVTPAQVQTIVASDTLCDRVRVTWATMANIDSFQIRRNAARIGMVLGNANPLQFDDLTATVGTTYTYTVVAYNECGAGAVATGNQGTIRVPGTGTATFTLVTAGPPNWTYSMDVNTGCQNQVVIRDFCVGTTATAPAGWTVILDNDSIIFRTTSAVGAQDPVVTGFVLTHPTCDGDGRWGVGDSGGSIRGPLPVGDNALLPTEYSVNVYPNPFNPQTNFKIAVPQAAETRILVFNIAGQIVRDMTLGRLQAGYHTVQFGGADLPSGMYFARIVAGSFSSTHKLMLLK